MNRREFITLLGGAAVWRLTARAQQLSQARRIAVLIGVSRDAEGQARVAAFKEALQALGWTDGRNVQFDERWSEGDAQLMQRHAKELVAGKPDVILVATNPALAAMRQETRTVPIVFAQVVDQSGPDLLLARHDRAETSLGSPISSIHSSANGWTYSRR